MKKWFEPFSTALVGVSTHKLRSFLTTLGIVIGVGAVIIVCIVPSGFIAIEGLGDATGPTDIISSCQPKSSFHV